MLHVDVTGRARAFYVMITLTYYAFQVDYNMNTHFLAFWFLEIKKIHGQFSVKNWKQNEMYLREQGRPKGMKSVNTKQDKRLPLWNQLFFNTAACPSGPSQDNRQSSPQTHPIRVVYSLSSWLGNGILTSLTGVKRSICQSPDEKVFSMFKQGHNAVSGHCFWFLILIIVLISFSFLLSDILALKWLKMTLINHFHFTSICCFRTRKEHLHEKTLKAATETI